MMTIDHSSIALDLECPRLSGPERFYEFFDCQFIKLS